MKKPVLTFFAALIVLTSFSSCVKEYICQCKIESVGNPGLPKPIVNEYTIKDKKETAKSLCEQASSSFTDPDSGIKTTETCKIF